jgi:hypothetical protein
MTDAQVAAQVWITSIVPVTSSTPICSGLPVHRGWRIFSPWAANHARPFTADRSGRRQSGRRKHARQPTGSPSRRGISACSAFRVRRSQSPGVGDAINAGFGYLEVKCLGCDTHQTVALDIVRPITTNQAAIIVLFRVVNRYVGNLPPMTGVFPDCPAPVVRKPLGAKMVLMRLAERQCSVKKL